MTYQKTAKNEAKKKDGILRLGPSEADGPAECAGLLGLELGGFIADPEHAWHPGKARGGGLKTPDGDPPPPLL